MAGQQRRRAEETPADHGQTPRRGALARYNAGLTERGPEGAVRRFLLSPAGTFLTNTPAFVLPGRINLQGKHRVLDIQAGRGAIVRLLAARVPFDRPPVAFDASLPALRLARRDLQGEPQGTIALIGGRPTYLPFADERFDLVIAAHVFRRLADHGLVQCLQEIERVLRPNGVLVAWDFAPTSSHALNRLHAWLLRGDALPPHLRGFGPLSHFASEAGFVRVERARLRPFLFPPIPHTAMLAQKWNGVEPFERDAVDAAEELTRRVAGVDEGTRIH